MSPKVERLLEYSGLAGLLLFSLNVWWGGGRAKVGLGIMVLASVLDARFWAALRQSPVAWVVGLTGAYLLLRTAAAAAAQPELANVHVADGWRLLLLSGFLFVGWSLAGSQRWILTALTLALAGFVIGRVEHFDWYIPAQEPWWTLRPQFGLPSANAFAEYAAAGLLGLVIMAPRMWRSVHSPPWRWLAVACWLVLALVLIEGVLLSSRGRYGWRCWCSFPCCCW